MEKLEKHLLHDIISGNTIDLKQEELQHFSLEFHKQYNLLKEMETQHLPISKTDLHVYSIYKEQTIDLDYASEIDELKNVSIKDHIKLKIALIENQHTTNRMQDLFQDFKKGSKQAGLELYKTLGSSLGTTSKSNVVPISNFYEEQKEFFTNMVEGRELEGLMLWGNNKKNTRQFMGLSNILKRIALTDFMVIGARPSVGKTSFALALMNALCKNDYRPMFISLEMTNGELLQRMATSKSGLSYDLMMSPETQITEEQATNYYDSLKEASEMDILLMENPPTSWLEMKRKMIEVVDQVDYFVIDHMHIISTYDGQTNANKNDMYGEISRDMKLFARDYKKPIILLVQLNREVRGSNREDPSYAEPFMTDIRASGNIEQDADKVLMLYRGYQSTDTKAAKEMSKENQKKYGQYIINCKIEKNRAGSLGNIRYLFQAKNGRWSEINENKKEGVSENGKYTVKKPSV